MHFRQGRGTDRFKANRTGLRMARFCGVGSVILVCLFISLNACGLASVSRLGAAMIVRAVRWHVSFRPNPDRRVVELVASVPYCVYTMTKPHIQRLVTVERRQSTLVTMRVQFHYKGNPPEKSGCADVSLLVSKRLKLRQSLRNEMLYDGSTSPPLRRWPR